MNEVLSMAANLNDFLSRHGIAERDKVEVTITFPDDKTRFEFQRALFSDTEYMMTVSDHHSPLFHHHKVRIHGIMVNMDVEKRHELPRHVW